MRLFAIFEIVFKILRPTFGENFTKKSFLGYQRADKATLERNYKLGSLLSVAQISRFVCNHLFMYNISLCLIDMKLFQTSCCLARTLSGTVKGGR